MSSNRLLLIQPKGVQEGFTRGGTKLPPLGLLYIAASCRRTIDVKLVDADALNLDDSQVITQLGDWVPNIVGMTVSSLTLPVISRFSQNMKQAFPHVNIIAGGPLAITAPNEVLKCQDIDYVGLGDGEVIMPDLCEALDESSEVELVEGVLSRKTLRERIHQLTARRASLSNVRGPAWDMILDFSPYTSPDCMQFPVTIVEGQRGCLHNCTFCSVPCISGKVPRFRTKSAILDEISYLVDNRGVREISFVDPDFMANQEYASAISDGIIKMKNDITWFCNARASSVDEKLAQRMKTAGCHLVYLGVESGDQDTLTRIHKHQTPEQIEAACIKLRNSGIQISAGFIIGFPFDTDESIRRTIEFAKRLRPAKFQFSLFNWFPGISMEVPKGFSPTGFHPKSANPRWLEWQRKAYNELES